MNSPYRQEVRQEGCDGQQGVQAHGVLDTGMQFIKSLNHVEYLSWWVRASLVYLRMEYHFQSGTHYVMENPTGSLLFEHPAIKARLREHRARTVNICLGALGAPTRKCATGRALWRSRAHVCSRVCALAY